MYGLDWIDGLFVSAFSNYAVVVGEAGLVFIPSLEIDLFLLLKKWVEPLFFTFRTGKKNCD